MEKWNGTEISVWNTENAGMEWKISRMEWKTIFYISIPITFWILTLCLQKNTHRCRVVINNIVTEVFNFNIYAYYLSTNRDTLVVYITQKVYVLHHCKYRAICSIDVMIENFDRLDLFFFLRLTICQVLTLFSYIVTKTRS